MPIINIIYSVYTKCLKYITNILSYEYRSNIDLEKGLWQEYTSDYESDYESYLDYDSYGSNNSEDYPEYIGFQKNTDTYTPSIRFTKHSSCIQ